MGVSWLVRAPSLQRKAYKRLETPVFLGIAADEPSIVTADGLTAM